MKTRPVLKVAWQGLSDDWGTQWVKSWGLAEKVMFSSHDLKTLPQLSESPFHTTFNTGLVSTVDITKKKFSAAIFKNYKTALSGGLVHRNLCEFLHPSWLLAVFLLILHSF